MSKISRDACLIRVPPEMVDAFRAARAAGLRPQFLVSLERGDGTGVAPVVPMVPVKTPDPNGVIDWEDAT